MPGFKINIDLNVLNHLGMGLYSNTPAVLTEIISNAWDADAENVRIDLDKEKNTVTIIDDGIGMSEDDIINKFLNVGYARRDAGHERSTKKLRQVMGRKGIGKLAMFSLSKKIKVTTHREGFDPKCFIIDVDALRISIKNRESYIADEEVVNDDIDFGTKIELFDLDSAINKTENFLRRRIARRFSVIGPEKKFSVKLNGKEISISDRDYLSRVQFIWEFGESIPGRIDACKKLQNKKVIPDFINYDGRQCVVSGYIASVKLPSELKEEDDISNNTITIMANGRIFEEDVLPSFGSAKVFTSYLVGELEMDFLDNNSDPDMATSSRQQLQQNDPRYKVLKTYFDNVLSIIDKDWDVWRRGVGAQEVKAMSPEVEEWFDSLQKHEQKSATSIFGKINTCRFSGTQDEQEKAKKDIIKNTFIAFERFRVKDNLEQLEKIDNIDSGTFSAIFNSVDEIETSLFHDITSQRLKIIERFKEITNKDEKSLEKVVQKYLYDHLWLLDPSWDRVGGTTQMEVTLTKQLQAVEPESKGARVDIAYRTISGKHLIIELKRPSIKTGIFPLIQQGAKYRKATIKWYEENPNQCPVPGKIPPIEVIFLLGSAMFEDEETLIKGQLDSISGRVMTYSDLISQSEQAYYQYIDSRSRVTKFQSILDSL